MPVQLLTLASSSMLLFRNKRVLKATATVLLVQIVVELLFPLRALALTSGPTTPEATSFEPVDTSEMVNLNTGDFVYNVPLLEVPGPEGGYPLSLSYHAGIQPEEEASWVGLGWTLNPGAITRNVNGYADDHRNQYQNTRYYWEGGSTRTISVGVNVGIAETPASVSAGLSVSHDTYQGTGVGGYVGLGMGMGITKNGNANGQFSLSAGIRLSDDGYGNGSLGVSAGVGLTESKMVNLGASVGVSTNFESVNTFAGGGVSAGGASLLGASLSSGSGAGYSVGGQGGSLGIRNDTQGKVTNVNDAGGIALPVLPGILSLELGYAEHRYWADEISSAAVSGSLYFPKITSYGGSASDWDNVDYDTYRLPEKNSTNVNVLLKGHDPDWELGGSLPNYDDYMVSAQGVGGRMRPFAGQLALYSRNRKNQSGTFRNIVPYPLGGYTNSRLNFRFDGDFSNSYRQDFGSYELGMTTGAGYQSSPYAKYAFDGSVISGDYISDNLHVSSDNNSVESKTLVSSKHVEWFTNQEISSGKARQLGFIDASCTGFTRPTSTTMLDQIGGFKITNESGVTFHYALPVYCGDEYYLSRSIYDKVMYNDLYKPSQYAYTWCLTAVTGPDYVDKTGEGLVNDGDWGYWVSFSYGKWVTDYPWRNPFRGESYDLDGSFKNFSCGKKEIYYLNTISTRSHVAIFEKSLRADGKSCPAPWPAYAEENGDRMGSLRENLVNYKELQYSGSSVYGEIYFPKSLMKLNRIILLEKKNTAPLLASSSAALNTQDNLYNFVDGQTSYSGQTRGRKHLGGNVLDSADVASVNAASNYTYLNKSIRIINFNYNYSLSGSMPNSFDPAGKIYGPFSSIASNGILGSPFSYTNPTVPKLMGRLTLCSVDFKGAAGVSTTPPIQFGYDLEDNEKKPSRLKIISAATNATSFNWTVSCAHLGDFEPGDVLKMTNPADPDEVLGYCLITDYFNQQTPSTSLKARFIGPAIDAQFIGKYVNAEKTKNPPYAYDFSDYWNMFKGDFIKHQANTGINVVPYIFRAPTAASARAKDCWSLRKIVSPTGATIRVNYESDSYSDVSLKKASIMGQIRTGAAGYLLYCPVDRQCPSPNSCFCPETPIPGTGWVEFADYYGYDLDDMFYPGQKVDISASIDNNGAFANVYNVPVVVKKLSHVGNRCQIEVQELTSPAQVFKTVTAGSETGVMIGIVTQHSEAEAFGGGIRVNSVELKASGYTKVLSYTYTKTGRTGSSDLSSGVTASEPGPIDPIDKSNFYNCKINRSTSAQDAINQFVAGYYRAIPEILALARVAPSPGVLYEYVTQEEKIIRPNGAISVPGKKQFQFEVFKPNMIGVMDHPVNLTPGSILKIDQNQNRSYLGYGVHEALTSNVNIKDFTSRLGLLKRCTLFDGNGKKMSETINHYLHDDLNDDDFSQNANPVSGYEANLAAFNHQGVVQEAYGDARFTWYGEGTSKYDLKIVTTKCDYYPVVATGTTTFDYVKDVKSESKTLGFDFYSGAVTKSAFTDAYGNNFLTETVPAYREPGYGAMGPRGKNNSYKNMLTQQAETFTYKTTTAGVPTHLINAQVTTWSNVWNDWNGTGFTQQTGNNNTGVWRPAASYQWMPTGNVQGGPTIFPQDFANYFTDQSSTNWGNWKKTGEVTAYDVHSHAIEAKDINSLASSSLLAFDNSKVVLSGGPARLQEAVYTGAEELTVPVGPAWPNCPPTSGSNWPSCRPFSGGIYPTWVPQAGTLGSSGTSSDGAVINSTLTAYKGKSHTGNGAVLLFGNKHGMSYSVPLDKIAFSKPYRAMVWAWMPTTGTTIPTSVELYYSVDGATSQPSWGSALPTKKRIGNSTSGYWYLLELTIPPMNTIIPNGPTGHSLRVACKNRTTGQNVYVDDFRFQPLDAHTNAFVYDPLTGQPWFVLDNNNFYKKFSYDAAGRLKGIEKETLKDGVKPVAAYSYKYSRSKKPVDDVAIATTVVDDNNGHLSLTVTATFPATMQASGTTNGVDGSLWYNSGVAPQSPFVAVSGLSYPQTQWNIPYPGPGTYWLRLKVSGQSDQREIVKKVFVN